MGKRKLSPLTSNGLMVYSKIAHSLLLYLLPSRHMLKKDHKLGGGGWYQKFFIHIKYMWKWHHITYRRKQGQRWGPMSHWIYDMRAPTLLHVNLHKIVFNENMLNPPFWGPQTCLLFPQIKEFRNRVHWPW